MTVFSDKTNPDNEAQRKRTGNVDDDRPLVGFLYELMRDHLPVGVVERIARNSAYTGTTSFTNGHLARYAQDLAERLTTPPKEKA